jgi:peptide methionine sulfoxide reductase MsrB
MENQFSFQDLLTQMHIDEIEEAEVKKAAIVDEELATVESMMGEYDVEIKQPSFLDFMTGLAIKEEKKPEPTFTDILSQIAINKSKEPSFTDILT